MDGNTTLNEIKEICDSHGLVFNCEKCSIKKFCDVNFSPMNTPNTWDLTNNKNKENINE